MITVHSTGSLGNLIQVDDILIDPGIPIQKIKKALNFKLSEIRACLLSHEHNDHSRGSQGIMAAGIPLYCSEETAHGLGLKGHRLQIVESEKLTTIGPWHIIPFDLKHDVHNLGFLLGKNQKKFLYATDTNYIRHRFVRLTHILLGVDYDRETLRKNIMDGVIDKTVGKRVLTNHMSIQTAIEFFKNNDMSKIREIHLLHLSDTNSDAQRFKTEIEKIIGRPVYINDQGINQG